jgi:hypothetical protein
MSVITTDDRYLTPQEVDRSGFHEASHYFTLMTMLDDGVSWLRHGKGDYLVGYNLEAHRLVGAIGPGGFIADVTVPPARFPTPVLLMRRPQMMASKAVLAYGSSAYELMAPYAMTLFFETPDGNLIRGIGQVFADMSQPNQSIELYTCIATAKTLYVLNSQKALLFHVALAYSDRNLITVGRAANGDFIVRVNGGTNSPGETKEDRILVVSPTGEILRTSTLPAATYLMTRDNVFFEDTLVPAVAPPAGLLAIGMIRQWFEPASLAKDLPQFRRTLGLSFGVAVPLAIGVFLLTRYWRLKVSVTLLWTLLVLLLGGTGVFLLFSLRGMPTRVRCHACGKLRPVEKSACPNCAAEFVPPAKNGTEIFA